VVTPLTPVDWAVIYDGQSISLFPSIGRHDAPCRSHYWIRDNGVIWSDTWSRDKVNSLKRHETGLRDQYFGFEQDRLRQLGGSKPDKAPERRGWLHRVWKRWRRKA